MINVTKKAYCYKTYSDYSNNPGWNIFVENNWYTIEHETEYSYIIKQVDGSLFKFYKDKLLPYFFTKIYSRNFYTEQEYNRIKNLDELLNE